MDIIIRLRKCIQLEYQRYIISLKKKRKILLTPPLSSNTYSMGINVNEVFIANEQSPQKFQLDAAKFDYYCKENGIKEENIAELKKSMQEYFAGYNNLS